MEEIDFSSDTFDDIVAKDLTGTDPTKTLPQNQFDRITSTVSQGSDPRPHALPHSTLPFLDLLECNHMRMFMNGKPFIAAGSGFSGGKMEQKRKAKARKRPAETQTAA